MRRKLVAVGLVVAVQAAAVGAPRVHAHLGNHAAGHHDAVTVHSHFSGHHSSHSSRPPVTGLRVEDNDAERTIALQLFVAVSVASFGVLSAVVESFEINVPAETPRRQALLVVHGHDPPFTRLRPARAPPANLS